MHAHVGREASCTQPPLCNTQCLSKGGGKRHLCTTHRWFCLQEGARCSSLLPGRTRWGGLVTDFLSVCVWKTRNVACKVGPSHTHTHTHRQMPWQRKRAIQHGVRDICNGEVGHGYGIKHGPEAIVPLSAVPWRSRHARTCTTVARAGDHRSAGERHVVPHGRGDERGHNIKHSSHYGLHHPHSHPQGCQQRHNSPGGAQQTIPIPHPGCQWQVVDQRQPQRHHPP